VTLDVENLEGTVQLNGILSDLQDAVPVYILPGLTPKGPPEISDWKTIMPRNLFRVEFWAKGGSVPLHQPTNPLGPDCRKERSQQRAQSHFPAAAWAMI
jgi:hypothetical protein